MAVGETTHEYFIDEGMDTFEFNKTTEHWTTICSDFLIVGIGGNDDFDEGESPFWITLFGLYTWKWSRIIY